MGGSPIPLVNTAPDNTGAGHAGCLRDRAGMSHLPASPNTSSRWPPSVLRGVCQRCLDSAVPSTSFGILSEPGFFGEDPRLSRRSIIPEVSSLGGLATPVPSGPSGGWVLPAGACK